VLLGRKDALDDAKHELHDAKDELLRVPRTTLAFVVAGDAMNRLILALGVLAPMAGLGCAPDFTYVPVATTSAVVSGHPAADYSLTPATTKVLEPGTTGEVRLAALGIVPIRRTDLPGSPTAQALTVRMVVTNGGQTPWVMDTREQHVEVEAGAHPLTAFLPASEAASSPVFRVEPGTERAVDLVFPLAEPVKPSKGVPGFYVLWTLEAGSKRVERRTAFTKHDNQPPDEDSRWQRYAF
jgi:hypothetical protein